MEEGAFCSLAQLRLLTSRHWYVPCQAGGVRDLQYKAEHKWRCQAGDQAAKKCEDSDSLPLRQAQLPAWGEGDLQPEPRK